MATNTSHYNLVKPAYTEPADIGVINGDMDLIDSALHDHDTTLGKVENSIAIVATGNTHAAISSGQYVYVKEHASLADGLYTASTNIAANATLSSSNLTAVSSGGMNALKASVDTLNSKLPKTFTVSIKRSYTANEYGYLTFNISEFNVGNNPKLINATPYITSLGTVNGIQFTPALMNQSTLYINYFAPKAVAEVTISFTVFYQ